MLRSEVRQVWGMMTLEHAGNSSYCSDPEPDHVLANVYDRNHLRLGKGGPTWVGFLITSLRTS